MTQAGLEPRRRAVALMTQVTEEHLPLHTPHRLDEVLIGLPPEERARALRLATEALRWANRSDRLLGPHLRMKPEDQVMNALRLALYEINVTGAPSHAAVNAAVSIVKKSKAGLVNAVLRNVVRMKQDWDALPPPQTAKWLRKRLIATWKKEAVAAMEIAHSRPPALDLTVKSDAAAWAEKLGAELLPTGNLRLAEAGQVSAIEGYDDGAWWVQDAGATLPALMLDAQPGERVLDLCAAPGGKTMQLVATGADVTALDISDNRVVRLRQNLARVGMTAELVIADALEWTPEAAFDAILLDAPCTATGTLRRHPDLGYAKDGTELETLVPFQSELIDRALGWLKPGGRLVYCTCSLLPEEGEAQLAAALKRHPDLTVGTFVPEGVDPAWVAPGGGLRLRPDYWAERGGIDGFFTALLQKPA
ncbi:transcription antitermination factor NusB [uncultured Boseongicola sp.]|uniref:RsmB/NOP family class I SAM-dependent RNA methyltransferase n=1 Tax=uncultured Boseongicola sp. TaxID=1648499 RepID=UPI00262AFBFB|nr:transcription antitermination factor NusB [uncultured Boseongicola sp.]